MADTSAHLRSVLTLLGECQSELVEAGELDVARLLAIASLEIRLKLNNMGDAELRAICDGEDPDVPDRPGSTLET